MTKKARFPVVFQMLLFLILGNFSNVSYSPLAPFIKNQFILTSAQVGIITSVIFIGGMTVSVFSGFFVDRLGPRTAIKISFAVMALGGTIAFFSHSYLFLILGYYAIGFGYWMITPSTNSAIMKEYYPHHAPMMGIKQSGVMIGAALAAVILPLTAIHFSLRGSFLLILIIAASVFIITPRDSDHKLTQDVGKGYFKDFFGAAKSKSLLIVSLPVIFLSWGQQTLLTFYVLFERSNGFPILLAETFLAILLIGSITGRLFWGAISDRIFGKSRTKILSLIMALSGILFVLLTFVGFSVIFVGLFAFVLGMNAVGWNSTYVTLISEIAPRTKIGLFSGVSLIITAIGTIVGTPISGYITDISSYSTMWILLGTALIVDSIVFLAIGRKYLEGKGLLKRAS